MEHKLTKSYFLQYLNICNLALNKHKAVFPYKQILEIGEAVLGGKNIKISIVPGDSSLTNTHFMVRFNGGTFDVVADETEEHEFEWALKEIYLKKVVESPAEYIDHPEKIEWEWLKDRLSID